jgi:hypothetical protein
VHPNLAVTPPILRSVETNKDDAEVEARNPRAVRGLHLAAHQHGREHDGGRAIVEEAKAMSIGVSVFLLVVGAILTFAVTVSASGFNINTVGIILMLAGALGLLLSLLFWSSFSRGAVAGPGRAETR